MIFVKIIKKSINTRNIFDTYIVKYGGTYARSAYFINNLSQLEYFSNGKINGFLFLLQNFSQGVTAVVNIKKESDNSLII